jgi:hypothetical protein
MQNIYKKTIIVAGSVVVVGFLIAGSAFAASDSPQWERSKRGSGAAVGVVASISGSNINLSGKDGKIYVVDTTKAEIIKDGSPIQLSNIQGGDILAVEGKISPVNIAVVKEPTVQEVETGGAAR